MTFYLGGDLFGISILMVREINQNLDITPVAKVPQYVKGVLNLRGQVVTVMDLAKRLAYIDNDQSGEHSCFIVLKTNEEIQENHSSSDLEDSTMNDKIGLYVDRIGDVLSIESKDILITPNQDSKLDAKFVKGVVRLQDQLLVLLNLSTVLDPKIGNE